MTQETEMASPAAGRNVRDGSDATITVNLRWANQIKSRREKDKAKEVVTEEAATKDVAEEAEASTTHNIHHGSETSSYKWRILAQF